MHFLAEKQEHGQQEQHKIKPSMNIDAVLVVAGSQYCCNSMTCDSLLLVRAKAALNQLDNAMPT